MKSTFKYIYHSIIVLLLAIIASGKTIPGIMEAVFILVGTFMAGGSDLEWPDKEDKK